MSIKSGIKIAALTIVLAAILGYAYTRIEPFAYGPRITTVAPQDGEKVSSQLITVEGVVEHAAHITLNGRQVYTSETGVLQEEILLARGYNLLTLKATDRFGREKQTTIEIVYK